MNLLLLDENDFRDRAALANLAAGPPSSTAAEPARPTAADSAAVLRACVRGRRLAHVRSVHAAAVGDVLCVGLVGGAIGTGRIAVLDEERLEIDVTLERRPPPKLPVTLIAALPRPKVASRLLALAAAMGVPRMYLVNAWRVEKSFWSSPALTPTRIQESLRLGLEQARDTIPPEVHLRKRFKPFAEDELPALRGDSLGLTAHPYAASPCPRAVNTAVTLAVGPEGGWIDYEVETLERAGLRAVSLGERVLRSEAAVAALLGRLF